MSRRIAAAAVCAALFAAASAKADPALPLNHQGRWITDAKGRVVVLHGLNYMDKKPPYLPAALGLGADDAAFLHRQGFNVVRLGVMPTGIEPAPGKYSQDYLDGIVRAVRTLARRGVASIVDFHQDRYSERFGGQGLPAWMIDDDGIPDLGLPDLPIPVTDLAYTRAWDNFWANSKAPDGVGLQDHYAHEWALVAKALQGVPGVVGYDLMNEPWAGAAAPLCINVIAACATFERNYMTTFYRRVISAIRAVDTQSIVFYEPELLSGSGAAYDLGDVGDENASLSFHVYCLTYAAFQTSTPGCDAIEQRTFDVAEQQAARGGDSLLLTEFGSTPDASIIRRVADEADRNRVGWTEWTYYSQPGDSDFPGTPSLIKDPRKPPVGDNVNGGYLDALSRVYPQAFAGTPRSWSYDAAARRFALSYSADRARRALTEIVVPRRLYPHGYRVEVDRGTVRSKRGAQILKIAAAPGASGVGVRVSSASSR